jgi:preprotein translocase subunit SecE
VAQQENAPNKPVHLMYLGGAMVLFYITQWSFNWIWGYFVATPNELFVTFTAGLIAVVTGIVLYRHERVHTLANEVSGELKKVTWPSAKEVKAATLVVIIMALISASLIMLFDTIWSNLTELIYGG